MKWTGQYNYDTIKPKENNQPDLPYERMIMKTIVIISICVVLLSFMFSCSTIHEVPQLSDPDITTDPPAAQPPVSNAASSAGNNASSITDNNPVQPVFPLTAEMAENVLISYFEARKIGREASHVYMYFGKDDWFRDIYRNLEGKILDFIVEDMERVNDHLYEFFVLYEDDIDWIGVYVRHIFLVGIVDDKVLIINHPMDFHEEHWENFDDDRYNDFWWSGEPDDTRAIEINGKPIIQPGDPEYQEVWGRD